MKSRDCLFLDHDKCGGTCTISREGVLARCRCSCHQGLPQFQQAPPIKEGE